MTAQPLPTTLPRLVASDLDGTLLQSDGTVSERTREAVARVEAAGATFVMVTGRPPRWMEPLLEQLPHRGLAVCANGAVVYDLAERRVLREEPVAADVATEIVSRLRTAVPGVAFAVEGSTGFGHEPSYRGLWSHPGVVVGELDELLLDSRYKLLARHDGMSSDELLAQAQAVLGDLVQVTHSSHGGTALVEMSASGVTKASGLARLAAEAGVDPSQVLAFGDMPNDLPMLAWAGRSVAVGNAHPEVVEAADEVTGDNDDDGVAQVLDRLFGGQP